MNALATKILVLSCLLFASMTASAYDEVYCYSGDIGYIISTPAGFENDPAACSRFRFCAFYYPKGSNFNSAPVVIYPNFQNKESRSQSLSNLIEKDLRPFSRYPGAVVKKASDLKTKVGTWQIWNIRKGPSPNEFETIAYLDGAKSVYLLVMSARTEDNLKKHKNDFTSLLKSVRFKSKKTAWKELRKLAKEDGDSKEGNAYWPNFMKSFGPVLGNSMRACFPKDTPRGDPFIMILQIDSQGLVRETTFDREGKDITCIKSKVFGFKGEKPPKDPFHIEFEMTFVD